MQCKKCGKEIRSKNDRELARQIVSGVCNVCRSNYNKDRNLLATKQSLMILLLAILLILILLAKNG